MAEMKLGQWAKDEISEAMQNWLWLWIEVMAWQPTQLNPAQANFLLLHYMYIIIYI